MASEGNPDITPSVEDELAALREELANTRKELAAVKIGASSGTFSTVAVMHIIMHICIIVYMLFFFPGLRLYVV
jgi:hypothetical protein